MGKGLSVSNSVVNVLLGICEGGLSVDKVLLMNMGRGEVLLEIIRRIIKLGRKVNYTDKQIAELLDKNLYAYEYDNELYKLNIEKQIPAVLSKLCFKAKCNFTHLYNRCVLEDWEGLKGKFNTVIGLPIYSNMCDVEKGKKLKSMYDAATFYLLYSKLSLECLDDREINKCVMVLPRRALTEKCAAGFRRNIMERNCVSSIYDFTYKPIGKGTNQYICMLEFDLHRRITKYGYYTLCRVHNSDHFDLEVLDSKVFNDSLNSSSIFGFDDLNVQNKGSVYLVEKCIFYPKLNLGNKGGIMRQTGYEDGTSRFILFNGFMIEREAVIPVGNIATLNSGFMTYDTVLFLYKFDVDSDSYVPMSEGEVKLKYPRTYNYLNYYSRVYDYEELLSCKYIDKHLIKSEPGYKRIVCNFRYRDVYDSFSVKDLPDGYSADKGVIIGFKDCDYDLVMRLLQSKTMYDDLRFYAQYSAGTLKLNNEVLLSYKIPDSFQ